MVVAYFVGLLGIFLAYFRVLPERVLILLEPIWPLKITMARLKFPLFHGRKESLSIRQTVGCYLFLLAHVFFLSLQTLPWILDLILYPDWLQTKVVKPIFLLGASRTGSTTFHRALAVDEDNFVSPYPYELVFLSMKLQNFIAWKESTTPNRTKPKNPALLRFFGMTMEEVKERHPMGDAKAEEDDVFFMIWRCIGDMSFILMPFPKALSWMTKQSKTFNSKEMMQLATFHKHAVIQKVLYRRGEGGKKRYLSKTHFVDLVPYLAKLYPDAKFAAVVREPKASICSWVSLHRCVSRDLMNIPSGQEYVPMYVDALHHFYQEMAAFFKDGSEHKVFSFEEVITDVALCASKMYTLCGIPHTYESVKRFIEENSFGDVGHVGSSKKYKNLTLEEMGLNEATLNQAVDCRYLK